MPKRRRGRPSDRSRTTGRFIESPPARNLNAIVEEMGTDEEKASIEQAKAEGASNGRMWVLMNDIAAAHGIGSTYKGRVR